MLEKLIAEGKKFDVIYADPPWTFKTYTKAGEKKAPQAHYDTMTIEDICAIPVREVAKKDSILFMWVYQPLLPESFRVMEAWGFEYKTIAFNWRKLTKHLKPAFGTGYYTRAGMELCFLGRRGKPPRPLVNNVRQVFNGIVREHSRKPDEVYDFIDAMYAGDKLEMFARNTPREGWTKVGNEVGKF